MGDSEAKSGSIIFVDDAGHVKRWNFKSAVPAKYTGPTLDARASDVATGTLELSHDGLMEVEDGFLGSIGSIAYGLLGEGEDEPEDK